MCDTLETCHNIVEQITNNGIEKPGSFMWWTQTTAPDGWLICDGSQISRTTYSDLFSVIGTTFGSGDGSTTFTLPDMRATFVRGAGSQNGYTATFGDKQDATTVLYMNGNGPLRQILTNTDKNEAAGRAGTAQTANHFTDARKGFVRPYNIALTPVIKY